MRLMPNDSNESFKGFPVGGASKSTLNLAEATNTANQDIMAD